MGGPASGNRWRRGAKATTTEFRRLDVRRLAAHGVLLPGYWGGWQWGGDSDTAWIRIRTEPDQLVLSYRHRRPGADWKDEQYAVRIVKTPCHLGGSRPWFLCPARGCGRRVAILYGGAIFACRHCHQLAYDSSRESVDDRMNRRAEKLRARLEWEPGILNGEGGKPKWMRWRTFERLANQHEALAERSFGMMMTTLRLLDRIG